MIDFSILAPYFIDTFFSDKNRVEELQGEAFLFIVPKFSQLWQVNFSKIAPKMHAGV